MEKVINRIINDAIEGVDTYKTKDSTWIIFTESKKWVIELTKDGTLWYNYNFFNDLMVYLSMDVVENQHYITKWVEDNVINGVIHTKVSKKVRHFSVEDTIENGVKKTLEGLGCESLMVEDILNGGVKHTEYGDWEDGDERLDDIIQNGIKQTCAQIPSIDAVAERVVEEGIKQTIGEEYHHRGRIDGVIKNGVKETKSIDYSDNGEFIVDGVIEKGKII